MCQCTPTIRTPYCGRGDCKWPGSHPPGARTGEAYREYRRTQIAEMADWTPGFPMEGVSVSAVDAEAGSPKAGDKIARNPANHADKWLVAEAYFAANFEPLPGGDA